MRRPCRRNCRTQPCDVAILPGSLVAQLAEARLFAPPHAPKNILAFWRAPERLTFSASMALARTSTLIDIPIFGEIGLCALRRTGSRPRPYPGRKDPCAAGRPRRGDRGRYRAHSRPARSALADRWRRTIRFRMPRGSAGSYFKTGDDGTLDTGFPCRADTETGGLVVTGPPAGLFSIGGYRFAMRDVQDVVSQADKEANVAALPDTFAGHRLAGHSKDRAADAPYPRCRRPQPADRARVSRSHRQRHRPPDICDFTARVDGTLSATRLSSGSFFSARCIMSLQGPLVIVAEAPPGELAGTLARPAHSRSSRRRPTMPPRRSPRPSPAPSCWPMPPPAAIQNSPNGFRRTSRRLRRSFRCWLAQRKTKTSPIAKRCRSTPTRHPQFIAARLSAALRARTLHGSVLRRAATGADRRPSASGCAAQRSARRRHRDRRRTRTRLSRSFGRHRRTCRRDRHAQHRNRGALSQGARYRRPGVRRRIWPAQYRSLPDRRERGHPLSRSADRRAGRQCHAARRRIPEYRHGHGPCPPRRAHPALSCGCMPSRSGCAASCNPSTRTASSIRRRDCCARMCSSAISNAPSATPGSAAPDCRSHALPSTPIWARAPKWMPHAWSAAGAQCRFRLPRRRRLDARRLHRNRSASCPCDGAPHRQRAQAHDARARTRSASRRRRLSRLRRAKSADSVASLLARVTAPADCGGVIEDIG